MKRLSRNTVFVAQHCKSTLFFPKEQRKRAESCCPAISSSNLKINLCERDNSIYHPEINKEIWTKDEIEFQGTITTIKR